MYRFVLLLLAGATGRAEAARGGADQLETGLAAHEQQLFHGLADLQAVRPVGPGKAVEQVQAQPLYFASIHFCHP